MDSKRVAVDGVKRGYDDENDEVKCRVAVQAEMIDHLYDDER